MSNKKILTYRGAVATWECDSNGHMNVMYYMNKYEQAGRNLFMQLGFERAYMKAHNFGMVVVEQNIKYLKEVFEDDILYMESTLEGMTHKVISARHELKNGETHEVCGIMEIKLVVLDKERRKAVPIPEKVRAKAEKFS